MIDIRELETESAELLPGREALSRFCFRPHHGGFGHGNIHNDITNHVADVNAGNSSTAFNIDSLDSVAASDAGQSIVIAQ